MLAEGSWLVMTTLLTLLPLLLLTLLFTLLLDFDARRSAPAEGVVAVAASINGMLGCLSTDFYGWVRVDFGVEPPTLLVEFCYIRNCRCDGFEGRPRFRTRISGHRCI